MQRKNLKNFPDYLKVRTNQGLTIQVITVIISYLPNHHILPLLIASELASDSMSRGQSTLKIIQMI